MNIVRRALAAQVNTLGDDEVEVVIATRLLARDGDIWETAGAQLDNYRANPIWLWSHSPETPVGLAADIRIDGETIVARVVFAPIGVSAKADEIRGLVKSGVVRGVSAGILPLESEPLDAKKPRGGQRITKWELLEVSFVSVPADTGATVTARAADGSPTEPETDSITASDHAKETAETTAEAKKAAERRTKALRTRMLVKSPAAPKFRGLYDVAQLAYAVSELGYLQYNAQWEAEIEGDASPVPAMLGEALQQLGKALVAMTAEEVNELLAHIPAAEEGEVLVVELSEIDAAYIESAGSERARAWRRGIVAARSRAAQIGAAQTRAGRVLSAENHGKLQEAHDKMEEARGLVRSVVDAAEDSDPDLAQTSAGVEDVDGSRSAPAPAAATAPSADFRRRQADKLALAAS
jgi:HK97 family phage prohead protease